MQMDDTTSLIKDEIAATPSNHAIASVPADLLSKKRYRMQMDDTTSLIKDEIADTPSNHAIAAVPADSANVAALSQMTKGAAS